jgi:hypothetical protein
MLLKLLLVPFLTSVSANAAILIQTDFNKIGVAGAFGSATGSIAQSFTTPSGWTSDHVMTQVQVSIQPSSTPVEMIILDREFDGLVADLGSSSPGYLAASTSGTDIWDFGGVVLHPDTSYWFHLKPESASALLFTVAYSTAEFGGPAADPYEGGIFYGEDETHTYQAMPVGDLGFTISGTAIPEPCSAGAIAGAAALTLAVRRRQRASCRTL